MKLQHPLETVFNMAEEKAEENYDLVKIDNQQQQNLSEAPVDHKDDDDVLIEKRLDEIYNVAMETFNNQTSMTEIIDPRYAARNAEVAANYLNIALQAAAGRAKVKTDRKRANTQFVPFNNQGKTTNQFIVADRNEILKMITVDTTEKKLT